MTEAEATQTPLLRNPARHNEFPLLKTKGAPRNEKNVRVWGSCLPRFWPILAKKKRKIFTAAQAAHSFAKPVLRVLHHEMLKSSSLCCFLAHFLKESNAATKQSSPDHQCQHSLCRNVPKSIGHLA
jgi:hypothetical protein